MYGITLTVTACLRAGTRVDVAWLVDADGFEAADPADVLVITPGGGRVGSLLSGALDQQLADVAAAGVGGGRLVEVEVTDVDALIAGLPHGGGVRALVVPAATLPGALWGLLDARQPVCLVTRLDGDDVLDTTLHTSDTVATAGVEVERMFNVHRSGVARSGNAVVTVLWPVPLLVVVGDHPVVRTLSAGAALLGWRTQVASDAATATGLIAGLAALDKVVVASHDHDLAGRALAAALESDAGYIGALGGQRAQETRADWLAYRGFSDLSRIRGPAGLDIGAETPAEIALAILAEAVAVGAPSLPYTASSVHGTTPDGGMVVDDAGR